MPFDLCNGLASFQNYINDTLWEYLNVFCIMYLNDILIYSEIEAEHEIHIKLLMFKKAIEQKMKNAYIILYKLNLDIKYIEKQLSYITSMT